MSDRSSEFDASRAMARRTLTIVVCLGFLALPGRSAMADSIMGTVEMAITGIGSGNGGLPNGVIAISGSNLYGQPQAIDLSVLPLSLGLSGPSLGFSPTFTAAENNPSAIDEIYNQTVNTTFDMKIAFEGASGSQPTVNLTGSLVGAYVGGTLTPDMSGRFTATPMSATLENWSPSSGIPLSLLEQYLNTASYQIVGAIGGSMANDLYFSMTVDPSMGVLPAAAPEPSTLVVFAAMAVATMIHRRCRKVDQSF